MPVEFPAEEIDMIVLDSTKSLEIIESGMAMEVVVAYCSIDSAGLWTPNSYEVSFSSGTTVILAAPGGAEVKRVIENVWIYTASAISGGGTYFALQLRTSGTARIFRRIDGSEQGYVSYMTFVLKRDGSLVREYPNQRAPSASMPMVQNFY